ncbi:MAG: thioredoxin domain-containing protein [Isosphaeraceae bacterium]|nr:thioredoxin domain-containing protein [Isosphaeraceae bacterium]
MKIATLLFALVAANGVAPRSEPVLLDFQATWCGPCRQMRPVVEQLIEQGYPVKEVDVDQSPQLAAHYQVEHVPTFVVIDPANGRALARMEGARPASDLVSLYREAKAKLPSRPARPRVEPKAEAEEGPETEAEAPRQPARSNPNPWETVVRIKIYGQGSVGFGSGTIVHSTPKEAIILTCAHIFKLEGRRQARPTEFPNKIVIDLFDGHLQGQQVHYAHESYQGEAMDYDFDLDVGLIRIRPGRRLPSSRIVPANWHPAARMKMITVGCSEGHDATAWSTTILNPGMKGQIQGHNAYEAIECWYAPKQGRSGGGLYTEDGYVAGVCDFAEPRGNHGLYATPRSIYAILDRNDLMALYAPNAKPGRLLANNAPKPRTQAPRTRAQSPDAEHDEADLVTIPSPELLGISSPRIAQSAPHAKGRKTGWVPTPKPEPAATEDTELTDLKLPPSADNDRFASLPNDRKATADDKDDEEAPRERPSSKWRPVQPATSGGR